MSKIHAGHCRASSILEKTLDSLGSCFNAFLLLLPRPSDGALAGCPRASRRGEGQHRSPYRPGAPSTCPPHPFLNPTVCFFFQFSQAVRARVLATPPSPALTLMLSLGLTIVSPFSAGEHHANHKTVGFIRSCPPRCMKVRLTRGSYREAAYPSSDSPSTTSWRIAPGASDVRLIGDKNPACPMPTLRGYESLQT